MSEAGPVLKEIFSKALECGSAAERARYLTEACGGNTALRGEVEGLLGALHQAGSFLEAPAVRPAGSEQQAGSSQAVLRTADCSLPTVSEILGTMIGPYKLLQQIGEGGMGTVYMAEQTEPVKRKVALKLIKAGMDSKQIIARFEAERQALAMMDHVNIARVLDGGTTEEPRTIVSGGDPQPLTIVRGSGRPYFVMELVHGVPITKYCDDNHLTPRERLELFVPVCQAIQHAHQKGIIHRDIKPSNVMVTLYDGKPVPKVIDFGVAKATEQKLTERTLFTQYGTMIGTLEYMSPEQAEMSALGVDTRSDIYSLGVLLYELLTGSTPLSHKRLKEAAYAEILRMIKEEEPPKPSTRLSDSGEALASISANRHMEPAKLTKLVRGELDWIVMKTLEKDRNHRYETANAFAADVQRYLNDEPVLACPPSAWYRFRKFARRNKGPVAAGLALAALLVLGTVGTSIGLAWALRAERTATLAAEAEAEQRQRAEAAYEEELKQRRRARKIVDEMYTQVAQKWLAQQPRMEKVQREFLEKALQYYQELAKEQSTDPAVQLETATAYRRMGDMYHKLGQVAKADEAYGLAIALLEKLAADYSTVRDYRQELASNYHNLGSLQSYTGRPEEAKKSFGKALKINEQLVVDFPAEAVLRHHHAMNHHHLGNVLSGMMGGTGRPKEAVKAYRKAVELYKGLATDSPDEADYQSSLGGALSDWAMVLLMGGELAEAGPLLKEAISRQQAALKLEPRQPVYRQFLSSHLAGWADIAEGQGDHEEAVKTARQALAVQEKLAEDFPEVPHYRHAQAERAYDLGRLLKKDSVREAEAIFRQAVSHLEKLAGTFADVPERRGLLADCYRELGLLLDGTGRHQAAVADYRAALKWEPKAAPTLRAFGLNLLKQRKFADAEPLLRESLKIREQKLPDDWMTFDTKSMLGGALLGQKKYADAEPLLLKGYEGMKQREATIPAPGKIRLAEALARLVQLYDASGQKAKADEWRKKLPVVKSAKPAETKKD